MRRIYICPKCGKTELRWDYGQKVAVCIYCGISVSKWKIREEPYEEIVLTKEPEPQPEHALIEITRPMEKQPLREVHEEIHIESKPKEAEIAAEIEVKPKELEISPKIEQEPPTKIREDLLPADFDRLISKEELMWDPYNPREEEPLDDLVESIRKTGFAEPIIVRPSDDGKFLVTDGWQRAQAGVMAGWRRIPCKIYASPLEALEETDRRGIKREWTKYQKIKFYRNFYDACRDAGVNHQEALQRITKKSPAIEQRVLTYLRITRLPPLVQALLKEPKNRTTWEWDQLEKIYHPIRLKRKPLKIGQADAIARYLQRVPPEKQVRAAIGVLGLTTAETIRKIRIISKYPEEDPLEIIRQLDIGYGIDEILDVGSVIVKLQLKRALLEYCAMRRISLKDFVMELLIGWWTKEKGEKSPN